jgi:hypothetical protein
VRWFGSQEHLGRIQMNFDEEFFDVLELLRNGALITGDCLQTNLYRQRCLEHALHTLSTSIVPALLAKGVLTANNRLENLIDIGCLHQKQCIRPKLSGAIPAFP